MPLDPQASREARAAAVAEKPEPQLNADFPRRKLHFDPWFFGVEGEYPKATPDDTAFV